MRNYELMQECPSWINCSAPKCPLDSLMNKRIQLPGDEKCVATKRVRMCIGKDLPNQGLFKRELMGLRMKKEIAERS